MKTNGILTPVSLIASTTALVPPTLTLSVRSGFSSVNGSTTPAMWTTASTPSTALLTEPRSVTSPQTTSVLVPRPFIFFRCSSTRTSAPSLRNALQMLGPKCPAAPVISTRISILLLFQLELSLQAFSFCAAELVLPFPLSSALLSRRPTSGVYAPDGGPRPYSIIWRALLSSALAIISVSLPFYPRLSAEAYPSFDIPRYSKD